MPTTPTLTLLGQLRPASRQPLPLLLWNVCAGFPSPGDDYVDQALDLNELLVRRPAATFMMRVHGRSMETAGIHDGDLVIVDRSIEPQDGHVVIASLCGALTIKRVLRRRGRLYLMPDGVEGAPIRVTEEMELRVWGVVTHAIHDVA